MAAVITFNTDTLTVDVPYNILSTYPVETGTIAGGTIARFTFRGDLNIAAGDTIRAVGSRGLSLYSRNNMHIGAGASFDVSASGRSAGVGGGNGGIGGTRRGAAGGGGDGAPGGSGAAGAGGTVKLFASVVDGAGVTIDVTGGSGGHDYAGQAPNGGNGRFILGQNTVGMAPGSIIGGATEAYSGSQGVNALIKGGATQTPYIPDLIDGAGRSGLLGVVSAMAYEFDALRSAAPTDSVAALMRLDVGPTGYADDYTGFDTLLLLNLTGTALADPVLGVDPAGVDTGFSQPLTLEGSFLSAAYDLTALPAYMIYMTLVPEGGTLFNADFSGVQAISTTLGNGQVAYLIADPVSLPSAIWLLMSALLG